ncbi:hypothetical protein [Aestuariicoccus sp. MJ-SS9]|uniref:hypothetical protein n=1 Tax=Aestuariicoccus sp. MJ-SS9 TaxID=3079855 RepID=UPI00292F5B6F|nr:hypothetical protein [Aestuariicoccus sp. MJ-SS9]
MDKATGHIGKVEVAGGGAIEFALHALSGAGDAAEDQAQYAHFLANGLPRALAEAAAAADPFEEVNVTRLFRENGPELIFPQAPGRCANDQNCIGGTPDLYFVIPITVGDTTLPLFLTARGQIEYAFVPREGDLPERQYRPVEPLRDPHWAAVVSSGTTQSLFLAFPNDPSVTIDRTARARVAESISKCLSALN